MRNITQYTNKIFLLSLFIIITALLLYLSLFKPLFQDEGVFLTISQGILDGKVPYRDFFDHKPPGIYFLLAPVIVIFGTNIWALKVFLFLNNFVAAFLVYKVAGKLKSGSGIFASILFLFTATFFEANYLIAEPFMATFLLGAIYFYYLGSDPSHSAKAPRDKKGTDPLKIFICGIMIGFAALMKQTAVVNFLILAYFIYKEDKNNILKYFAGAVLPWVPVIIYLLANNILKEAFNQIVLVNITNYPREPIIDVIRYLSGTFKQTLPVWVLLGIGLFGLDSHFHENDKEKDTSTSLRMTKKILLAFIFLPTPLLLVRHYPHYWLQVVPFVSILAGIQLYKMFSKPVILAWPESFKRIFDSGLVPRQNDAIRILILMLIIFSFYTNLRWYEWMANNQNGPKLREQMEAANYLKTLPQKNLLAENQFTAFYFLTGKESLAKYLYITEVNEPENAEQITIEKLKQNPDTIVLWPKDKEFAYAKELQVYILDNYKPVKEYPKLELMVLSNSK